MCEYTLLARASNGNVRWCHCCKTYSITFNNIVMNFEPKGFHRFKENLAECYQYNSKNSCKRECRDIYFNTRLEGMQLLFSTTEVGALLSLLQDASFHEISIETDSSH